jgi:aspartyl-tRNA(Asn)/glutamyl-tRNA(Gln) amidotransferase subunit A
MTHPQDLSLVEQAEAIARGELDATTLLTSTLTRIAERDESINSTPIVFEEQSRRMLADAPDGPLRGVPVTVKDMFALPWRAAREATRYDLIPRGASGAYRRLRDAGAVVVGVANQHEFGLGTPAPSRRTGQWATRGTPRAVPAGPREVRLAPSPPTWSRAAWAVIAVGRRACRRPTAAWLD